MWRNECAANGVGTTASATQHPELKTPIEGTPAVPKHDWPTKAPTSAMLAGCWSRLGFQTGTGAPNGRLSGSPRHGGDWLAALRPAMDREAMEAEETASNGPCDPQARYWDIETGRKAKAQQHATTARQQHGKRSRRRHALPKDRRWSGSLVKASSILNTSCGLGVRRTGRVCCL